MLKFVLQHKTRQFKDTPAPICVEGIIINTNIRTPADTHIHRADYKTDKIVTLSNYVVISGSVQNNWGTNGYKETDASRHKMTHLKWQIRKSSFCTNCLDSHLPVVHLQQGRKEVFHLSLYQRKHLHVRGCVLWKLSSLRLKNPPFKVMPNRYTATVYLFIWCTLLTAAGWLVSAPRWVGTSLITWSGLCSSCGCK